MSLSSRNSPASDNPARKRPNTGLSGCESSRGLSKRGFLSKMGSVSSANLSLKGLSMKKNNSIRKRLRAKQPRSEMPESSVNNEPSSNAPAKDAPAKDAPAKEAPAKPDKRKGPLKIDSFFDNDSLKYQVLRLIRNPGPNAEYIVREGEAEKLLRLSPKGKGKLKYAAQIIKKTLESNVGNEKAFMLEVIEVGCNLKYDYLITSSYGIQLYEVYRALDRQFTRDCVMNIAYQSLECIKALHAAGFINRNIKPSTFSIGCNTKDTQICLTDFRITRRHFDDATGKPRAARQRVNYIGTCRFASMSAMREQDQSRRDDCESWLYMIFDLLDGSLGLPWKGKGGSGAAMKKEVLAAKERFWAHAEPNVYTNIPEAFKKIVDVIFAMGYDTTPDYMKIFDQLDEICSSNHLDRQICDWTGKFNSYSASQNAIEEAANRTNDNICSGVDDFELAPAKKAPAAARPPRKMMNSNDTIKNGKFVWKVVNVLGSGGFGDVYRVYNEMDRKKKHYALKTESEDGKKVMLRLKVEMQVMMAIQEDRKNVPKKPTDSVNRHFVEFVDRGKADELKCKFIVMSIVGPSLDDVRKKYRVDLSAKSTPFNIACQTLEAVRDIHTIGFLHRDIKPANFAVGIDKEESLIYMLDFGICRMFIDPKTKVLRAPRKKVKFLGTLRFASRACMKCIDQGRKDDLECWLYMIFDLMDPEDGIPWKSICDRDKIVAAKTAFFQLKLSSVYENITRQMKTLVKYIDSLEYQSLPDYAYIDSRLQLIAEHVGHPLTGKKKAEWVGKLRKEDLERIKRLEEHSASHSNKTSGTNDSD